MGRFHEVTPAHSTYNIDDYVESVKLCARGRVEPRQLLRVSSIRGHRQHAATQARDGVLSTFQAVRVDVTKGNVNSRTGKRQCHPGADAGGAANNGSDFPAQVGALFDQTHLCVTSTDPGCHAPAWRLRSAPRRPY